MENQVRVSKCSTHKLWVCTPQHYIYVTLRHFYCQITENLGEKSNISPFLLPPVVISMKYSDLGGKTPTRALE